MKLKTFFSYNIAIKISSLILIFLPYVYFEKNNFKLYAFYYSISNYIIFLLNSSINNTTIVKKVFESKPFSLYVIKLTLLIFILPVIYFYAITTNNFIPDLFILSILFSITSIINLDYYFKGENINVYQKNLFLFSLKQILLLIISIHFHLSVNTIFTIFTLNSTLFFLYLNQLNKVKPLIVKKTIYFKLITGLFLFNVLNLLYYNLDVILSFYLKDSTNFKEFFIWTRFFSIITVLSTIFSEYFSNKIFLNYKPNDLKSLFEKIYLMGIFVFFTIILLIKSVLLTKIISNFPFINFLNQKFTTYYIITIPIAFVGPLFGYNLLHLKKQNHLIIFTFIGILSYLITYLLLIQFFLFDQISAISISFMISKFIIESLIIYFNFHFKVINFKTLTIIYMFILSPLILIFL